MNLILPSNKEKTLAKWLQSLFKFETTISYHIYDYGKRVCCINIEESNEPYPRLHTNDDSIDWDRGKKFNRSCKTCKRSFKEKIKYNTSVLEKDFQFILKTYLSLKIFI